MICLPLFCPYTISIKRKQTYSAKTEYVSNFLVEFKLIEL